MGSWIAAGETSPLQLAQALEQHLDLQIVDVRPPAVVAAGRIDLGPPARFHNVAGSDLLRSRTPHQAGLDASLPVVVVCNRGHDSEIVASHLTELGYAARSLRGGMVAWMMLVLPRAIAPPRSLDDFVQFDRPGNGALGYVLVSDGEALAVDPPRDASGYVREARRAGASLIGVVDSHLHADYVSGAAMLARTFRVPYYLHPRDAVSPYDGSLGRLEFHPIADGDAIRVGRSIVRVTHTPGHTEGSVSLLIEDAYVLTGDFIFLSSMGRPDLANRTARWTADLWRSLQTAKRSWPGDLIVCPAHYSPADSRRDDRVIAAPFARLLRENEAMQFSDEAGFATWVAARSGSFPDAYRAIKTINLGLATAEPRAVEELENGRNQCALSPQ